MSDHVDGSGLGASLFKSTTEAGALVAEKDISVGE